MRDILDQRRLNITIRLRDWNTKFYKNRGCEWKVGQSGAWLSIEIDQRGWNSKGYDYPCEQTNAGNMMSEEQNAYQRFR